jgi:2-hydroxychromene-2-carboxylate isomerase
VKKALIEATKHAESAGVFGAPTWVVDGTELFWGQDRIPLVERALRIGEIGGAVRRERFPPDAA